MRPLITALAREIFGTGERVGPGSYVYEPAEHLGEDGQVIETVSAKTQHAVYLAWCREHGVRPAEQILG
jgi:hypothetical protein